MSSFSYTVLSIAVFMIIALLLFKAIAYVLPIILGIVLIALIVDASTID